MPARYPKLSSDLRLRLRLRPLGSRRPPPPRRLPRLPAAPARGAGRLPPRHAEPEQDAALPREHVLSRRRLGAAVAGPHRGARRPARRRGLLHRHPRRQAGRRHTVPGDARRAAARRAALRHLLLALPRPRRRRSRHDRHPRLQAAAVAPQRAAAERAGRLVLQRHDAGLRGDAELCGAGAGGRPLGDRSVHPGPAVQPECPPVRAAAGHPAGDRRRSGILPASRQTAGASCRRPRYRERAPAAIAAIAISAAYERGAMSSSPSSVPQVPRLDAESFAAPPAVDRLQRLGLSICVIGLVGSVAGYFLSPDYFYRAYLVGWVYCVGIAFGCLALAMLNHLVGGGFLLVVRRQLEAATRTIPLLLAAAVPLFFWLRRIYPWADPAKVKVDPVLQWKVHSYLTVPFFIGRLVLYFVIAWVLMHLLNRLSLEQDRTADADVARRMRMVSGPG